MYNNSKNRGRVQFYDFDKNGNRRIFSFKVNSEQDAINALVRMNKPTGFYKPDEKRNFSKRIFNPYYSETKLSKSFIDFLNNI